MHIANEYKKRTIPKQYGNSVAIYYVNHWQSLNFIFNFSHLVNLKGFSICADIEINQRSKMTWNILQT